jgi:hypothetical protein
VNRAEADHAFIRIRASLVIHTQAA